MPPSPSSQSTELLKTLITAALVVIGWLIVDFQNNRRESRKEARKVIDNVVEMLGDLEKVAVEYHTKSERSLDLEREILRHISRLRTPLLQLRGLGLDLVGTYSARTRLRQALTKDNFASADFVQQAHNSDLLNKISEARDELESTLENAFARAFVPKSTERY